MSATRYSILHYLTTVLVFSSNEREYASGWVTRQYTSEVDDLNKNDWLFLLLLLLLLLIIIIIIIIIIISIIIISINFVFNFLFFFIFFNTNI